MKIRVYPALSGLPITARSQNITTLTSLANRQAGLGSYGTGRGSPDAPPI